MKTLCVLFSAFVLVLAPGPHYSNGGAYLINPAPLMRGMNEQPALRTVYFTIDDGPSMHSVFIDSILKGLRIKANVFLVGSNCAVPDSLVYRKNVFVEAGNHSFSHADCHYRYYYKHPANVLHDFNANAAFLKPGNRIARLPGRNTWRVNGRKATDLYDANRAADTLAQNGFVIFGWDIEWSYTDSTKREIESSEKVIAKIERAFFNKSSFTQQHVVVLCHEVMFSTPYARQQLACFLSLLATRPGYRFEWLSNYPTG